MNCNKIYKFCILTIHTFGLMARSESYNKDMASRSIDYVN
jgi:hypothetical protein